MLRSGGTRVLGLVAVLAAAGCGARQNLVSVGPDPAMRWRDRPAQRRIEFSTPRPMPDEGYVQFAMPIPTTFGGAPTMPANPSP